MNILKKVLPFIVFIGLAWWAVSPIMHSGFFPMHDDVQVARVYEMAKSLSMGQFPVRWVPDLGYGFGYPIFNFYSPLPYYVGALFIFLGFDALLATKIMFVIGILLAGIFMYFLAREFWGEIGGIVSGLFLIYAPYHAVQIYVRGAVGEFWALAFIPLAVWGFYNIYQKSQWKWIVIGAVGYAGVILSHNITAMIFTLFLIPIFIVFLYNSFKTKTFLSSYYFLLVTLIGVGLSAFFWLPALTEAKYVGISSLIGGTNDFHLHFLCPWQLWNSNWGFAGSAPGCFADGMSFIIGKIHILMSLVGIILMILWWKKDKLRSRLILFSFFFFLFSVFMTLDISLPIWNLIKPLVYVQYPWRFLGFIAVAGSIISGSLIFFIKNKYLKIMIAFLLLLFLFFYNSKYFKPQIYLNVNADYYTNEETLKGKASKISDEYLPKSVKNKPMEYNFKANNPIRYLANLISLLTVIFLIGKDIYDRKKEN